MHMLYIVIVYLYINSAKPIKYEKMRAKNYSIQLVLFNVRYREPLIKYQPSLRRTFKIKLF